MSSIYSKWPGVKTPRPLHTEGDCFGETPKPLTRFELATWALQKPCSTTELQRHQSTGRSSGFSISNSYIIGWHSSAIKYILALYISSVDHLLFPLADWVTSGRFRAISGSSSKVKGIFWIKYTKITLLPSGVSYQAYSVPSWYFMAL